MLPYRGQTVKLALEVWNNGDGQRSWMYVDDVQLTVCRGAATPTPTPTPTSQPVVIVDDGGAGFSKFPTSTNWWTVAAGYAGDSLRTKNLSIGPDENYAVWDPTLPSNGCYRLEAYIPYHSSYTPVTASARYSVRYGAGVGTVVTVNQSASANAWVTLGNFPYQAGFDDYVLLNDVTGESPSLSRWIAFDALRWTRLGATCP
ncbi:MAG: hypothetical protein GX605_01080 [Chloroflexi bacterium]|nr:hypothetical protein [Chloroflexota bacterium]